MLFVFVGIE